MIKAVKVPIFLGRNRAVRDRFLIKLLGVQRGVPHRHTLSPRQTFSRETFPDDFMRILSLDVKIVEPKSFKEGSPEHACPPGIKHGNGEIP